MSILIGRYEFEGPLINWRGVKQEPGIYAIMSYSYAKQEFELVELAESHDLQSILRDEKSQESWQRKSRAMLTFSVHYCQRVARKKRCEMVGDILREFDGDCRSFEPGMRYAVASGSR